MVDAPQINNAPDPIAMMQHVPTDLGSNLTAGWVKSIDDYINGIIHRVGDYVGAGVNKLVDTAASVGNAVSNVAESAVAPFKDGHIAMAPGGKDEPSRSGPERVREQSIEQSAGMVAALEQSAVSQGQGMEMAHVDRGEVGNFTPLATAGIAPQRGESMGRGGGYG